MLILASNFNRLTDLFDTDEVISKIFFNVTIRIVNQIISAKVILQAKYLALEGWSQNYRMQSWLAQIVNGACLIYL